MAVALIALFISLTGVAWAAITRDSVRSKHIKDAQVKEADLGPGAVTTDKVADESLVGDKLADETVTGSKIVDDTITGSKIENGSLSGDDVASDSLSGGDIDEATLAGLLTTNGSGCCSIRTGVLDLGTAYSPGDPTTFVTLSPKFELRTATTAGDLDTVRLCDTTGTSFAQLAYADLTGDRDTTTFEGAPRCHSWDINGAPDTFVGDIEIDITSPGITVWGSTATSSFMLITVLTHH